MRLTLVILFLVTLFSSSCRTSRNTGATALPAVEAQSAYQKVNYADPSTWLLGYISPGMFLNSPHSEWYVRGRADYNPDATVICQLRNTIGDDLSILIVLGTWCPDSRREVPRFMKIVEEAGFPVERIVFVGVDITKLAPVGGYDTLNIERVPTFIFLRNKVEAGRIIETPVTSLEQDMQSILTRNEN
ncbi:MAG: thioredoxin family protein [Bacteroidales bacterium]|nr:thioredoxin family protein [Bacteroidales bacterium]